MRNIILGFIILLVSVVLVAIIGIAHEIDIARQCKKIGNSGLAGWTVNFDCQPTNQ